jgi:hypothetical protein
MRRFVTLALCLLLVGCATDVPRELAGGDALMPAQALVDYLHAQGLNAANIVVISSQAWREGELLLFRYEALDGQQQRQHYLGLALAEPAGWVGWRVSGIATAERRLSDINHPIEYYSLQGSLLGRGGTFTRIAGRVRLAGAQRVIIRYDNGDESLQTLADGYFFDLHLRGAQVSSLVALGADGRPLSSP